MIKKITIENFGPFQEPITFDFTVRKDAKNDGVPIFESKHGNIANIKGVFGKNAAGKSTLLEAIYFVSSTILNEALLTRGVKRENQFNMDFSDFLYFGQNVFSEEKMPTKITLEIVIGKNLHTYYMSVNKLGFLEEAWKINYKTIFERKNNIIKLKRNKNGAFPFVPRINSGFSIVKMMLKTSKEKKMVFEFKEAINKIGLIKEGPDTWESFEGLVNFVFKTLEIHYGETRKQWIQNIENEFNKIFGLADLSIKSFKFNKTKKTSNTGNIETNYIVSFITHQPIKTTKEGVYKNFAISQGTIDFAHKILYLIYRKKVGGVMCWDEFGSNIHPQLISALLLYITSEKGESLQLIFNSNQAALIKALDWREVLFVDRYKSEGSTVWKPLAKDAQNKSLFLRFLHGSNPGSPNIDLEDFGDL